MFSPDTAGLLVHAQKTTTTTLQPLQQQQTPPPTTSSANQTPGEWFTSFDLGNAISLPEG